MEIKVTCRYCKRMFNNNELHVKENGQTTNACLNCWHKYYTMRRNNTNYCSNCRKYSIVGFGTKPNGEAYKTCSRCRGHALENHENNRCLHGQRRDRCYECNGSQICIHKKRLEICKDCTDPIKVTISQWIRHCRHSDKKSNRFDANHFIDTDFLKGLIEDYKTCFYQDCQVQLQYVDYKSNMATIERLDNAKGHIKSNCVLCCKSCNNKRKSDSTSSEQDDN